jgi:hypothetical protein
MPCKAGVPLEYSGKLNLIMSDFADNNIYFDWVATWGYFIFDLIMRIVLMTILSFVVNNLFGQELFYTETGMQSNGYSRIDTTISFTTKVHPKNPGYIFKKLDPLSGYVLLEADTVKLSLALDSFKPDSFEYFILYNSGTKPIKLQKQDGSMITVKEAINYQNKWLPVEFWNFSWCGNSYFSINVEPKQLVVLKTYKLKEGVKTKIRLRLKSESNGILVSEAFESSIDPDYFVLNVSLKKYRLEVRNGFSYLK